VTYLQVTSPELIKRGHDVYSSEEDDKRDEDDMNPTPFALTNFLG
jgi:hypothetical protein